MSRPGAAEGRLGAILDHLHAALEGPLAALRDAAEAVEPSDDPEIRQFLEPIADQARGLHGLTRAYFDHVTWVLRPPIPTPHTLALQGWLSELYGHHAEEAARRGLAWSCAAPPQVGAVRTDPELCTKIAHGLISNAMRFTPPGGHVEVFARTDPAGWTCSVSDDGPGIPESMREHVMRPFVQLGGPAPHDGTVGHGLGLATCRILVERLGGTLALGSRPGRGTLAIARFPAIPEA
jgi:signal transduction histidine kinase